MWKDAAEIPVMYFVMLLCFSIWYDVFSLDVIVSENREIWHYKYLNTISHSCQQ